MLFVASCSAEKPRCRGGPVTRRRFLFFADSSQWNLRRIAERNGNVIRERELAASISPPKKNPKVPEASSIHFDLGLSAPYLDLPFLRSGIPSKSLTPRIRWDFTPGESFSRRNTQAYSLLLGTLIRSSSTVRAPFFFSTMTNQLIFCRHPSFLCPSPLCPF